MAQQTVGEVITFFEGMAVGLFKTIDNIERRLLNLSKKEFKLELRLDDKINKSIQDSVARVDNQLVRIEDKLDRIFNQVQRSIVSVRRQAENMSDSLVMKLEKDANELATTFWSRVVTATAALSFLPQILLASNGVLTLNGLLAGTFSFVSAIGSKALSYFAWVSSSSAQIYQYFSATNNILGVALGKVLQIGTATTMAGVGVFMYTTFLKETVRLVKRVVGLGFTAQSPIERISRIITTIDVSLHSVALTSGQLFKTVGFGLLTFFGPFSGIIAGIPFINSVIDNLVNFGAQGRSLFLGWLGSGRAQLQAIFLSAKQITFSLLPIVLSSVKALNKVLGLGGFFGTIRRGLGTIIGFGGLTKRFTGFFKDIGVFLKDLFRFPTVLSAISKNVSDLVRLADGSIKHLLGIINVKNIQDVLNFNVIKKQVADLMANISKQASVLGMTLTNNVKNTTKTIIDSTQEIIKNLKFDQILNKMDEFKKKTTEVNQKVKESSKALRENQQVLLTSATSGTMPSQRLLTQTASIDGYKRVANVLKSEFIPATTNQQAILVKTEHILVSLIKRMLEYETLLLRLQQKPAPSRGKTALFDQDTRKAIQGFIDAIAAFAEKTGKSQQQVIASFLRLTQTLQKLPEVLLKNIAPTEQYRQKIQELNVVVKEYILTLEKLRQGNLIAFNQEQFKTSIVAFLKNFDKLRQQLNIKGALAGTQFYAGLVRSLQKGNDEGKKEFEKLLTILLNFVMSFFPSSPAKRGPLAKLPQAGAKIPLQLSKGMLEGVKHVEKAAATIAERIAKYFPRSPVALGALIFLIPSGLKIPLQIAKGMLQGVGYVANAAFIIGTTLISVITKTLTSGISFIVSKIRGLVNLVIGNFQSLNNFFKKIGLFDTAKLADEFNFISKQMNLTTLTVSKMDYAMRVMGGTVQDLTFPFRAINKIMTDLGDSETFEKFKRFGIDLREVAKAAKPNEELFLRISDAMKEYPRRKQELLELINVMAGSTTAKLLEAGREGYRALGLEASKSAYLIDQEFAELSTNFTRTSNKLKTLFSGVRVEVFKNILPAVNKSLDTIFDAFVANRDKLTAFLSIMSTVATLLMDTVADVAIEILKNPKAALEELQILATAGLKFAQNLVSVAWGVVSSFSVGQATILWQRIIYLAEDYFPIILKFITEEIPPFLNAAWNTITEWFDKLIALIKKRITDTFDFSAENLLKQLPREPGGILEAASGGNQKEALKNQEKLNKAKQENLAALEKEMEEAQKLQRAQERLLTLEDLRLRHAQNFNIEWAKAGQLISQFKTDLEDISKDIDGEKIATPIIDRLDNTLKAISDLFNNFEKEMEKRTERAKFDRLAQFIKETSGTPTEDDGLSDSAAEATKYAFTFADSLLNSMDKAMMRFIETGKLAFSDLAEFANDVFQESFKNVVEGVKMAFKEAFTSIGAGLSEAIGIGSPVMDGILNGIIAMAAFLFTKLKGSASVTRDAVNDIAVESAAAMRGVVAGIESIGIMEVSQRLITGISPLVDEVKSIHNTVRIIAEDIHFIRTNRSDLMTSF